MRLIHVTAALTLLQACSFVFVDGPPPRHEELLHFECSTNYVAPVLDSLLAGYLALGVAAVASQTDAAWRRRTQDGLSRDSTIAMYSAFAVLGLGGLYYGFNRVGDCRRARALLLEREEAPLALPPADEPRGPAPPEDIRLAP